MTMEFTAGRGGGRLPGGPKPYFLSDGEGEKAIVIDSLFTVLLSADETDGQFGVFTMDGPRGVTRSRRTRTAPTTRSFTWSAAG
jgi:quercetin 2,3-dioxygenase